MLCFKVGVIWTDLYNEFFKLLKPCKVICRNLFSTKWQFDGRGFKICDVFGILRCSRQKQIPVFKSWISIFFSCLKVSKLLLYNLCTFCSFVLLATVANFRYMQYPSKAMLIVGLVRYLTWSPMEGNWPISPTNITEIPPNGKMVRPVASLQRLLIQPNIFWPIIENSLIITYLSPFKSVCNLAKADDFNGPFFSPLPQWALFRAHWIPDCSAIWMRPGSLFRARWIPATTFKASENSLGF